MVRLILALSLLMSGVAAAADPVGDFDAYGVPLKNLRKDLIVAPRADPQHPNAGAEQIYPATSRQLGENGSVVLLLTVTEEGKVQNASVQTSSGYARLDEAARTTAVDRWHFLPGTINGKPASMQMPVRVTFASTRK